MVSTERHIDLCPTVCIAAVTDDVIVRRRDTAYEDVLLGISLLVVLLIVAFLLRRSRSGNRRTRYWRGELPGSQGFDYSYSPGIRGAKGGLPVGMPRASDRRDSDERR